MMTASLTFFHHIDLARPVLVFLKVTDWKNKSIFQVLIMVLTQYVYNYAYTNVLKLKLFNSLEKLQHFQI